MKKIGIFVDNNKLDKLKTAIEEAGYKDWKIIPHTTVISFMSTYVPKTEYKAACKVIRGLCAKILIDHSHQN